MITLKNKASIIKMQHAGQELADMCDMLKSIIQPGITSLDIDAWIESEFKKRDLVAKTKGYMGYKHSCCVSVNDEVVHGVPSAKTVIRDGDLVKVDMCASYKGYCADMARCFLVGSVDRTTQKLVQVAQSSLDKGIAQARAGNRLSDISAAIQQEVERAGFGVVRDFAGHGIGKSMHEDPEILNYGEAGQGPILRAGMTFALEPMITVGNYDVYVCKDGWTVKTVDKSMAAHVEDTVLITEGDPVILTRKLMQVSNREVL